MITKNVKYVDFDGVEREEPFRFNLTEAELAEMELSTEGGLEKKLKAIVASKDTPEIIKIFKELLLKSYGEKSPDGKRFMKKDENGRPLADKFAETEAYSVIFMELATDADAAAAFVNGIIPAKYSKEIEKQNHPALK